MRVSVALAAFFAFAGLSAVNWMVAFGVFKLSVLGCSENDWTAGFEDGTEKKSRAPDDLSQELDSALYRLANEEIVDTPHGLLHQIMAINYFREKEGLLPLYDVEDVKRIMASTALATAAQFPSVHINQRSLVQHELGSDGRSSCC